MLTRKFLCPALLLALALGACTATGQASRPATGQGPRLGAPVSEANLKTWDISVHPDGTNLPPGSGTPAQGARIYVEKCAACHGANGKGGRNAPLVGGAPLTDGINTPKTIANFWPYASTVFDFTRRAMPWAQPRTLTDDEVYALTAYILALNKLIGENDVMNAETLPRVRMPNRDGFMPKFPGMMP